MSSQIESFISKINSLSDEQRKDKLVEIGNSLDNLDLYKLMDIVYKYTTAEFFKDNDLNDLLELFKDKIISKLSDLSLIKVIDLYIELFNNTLVASDTMMASKNVLSVMSYNISSNTYIEKELEKKNITKEEYLSNLKKDLDKNVEIIDNYTKTYEFLDSLQDKYLIYIEIAFDKIKNQEKEYLIQNINKRFSDASMKLLKLKDNLDKVKGLEYSNLKNSVVIYENFRNSLLENKKDSND